MKTNDVNSTAVHILGRFQGCWMPLKRIVSYLLVILLPLQAFVGCSGGRILGTGKGTKYVYTYTMTQPENSSAMLFQDDSLKIQFSFDASAVRFQLQNLSSSTLTIRWERVSMGVDNRFYPVRHSADFYSDTSRLNATVPIPPAGYMIETAIPAENVRFDGTNWLEQDLFATTDRGSVSAAKKIERNVGKEVVFMLSLQFGGRLTDYKFVFRVASVTPIAWRDYKPPRRNPPVQPKQGLSIGDEITTAFISVGLLGFVAFMVSLKKDPIAE